MGPEACGNLPCLLTEGPIAPCVNLCDILQCYDHRSDPQRWFSQVSPLWILLMRKSSIVRTGDEDLGPVSLRLYELVYHILARKQEFLVYFQALSHRNLRGI